MKKGLFLVVLMLLATVLQAGAVDQVVTVTPQGDATWGRCTGWSGETITGASPNTTRYFYMGPPAYVEQSESYLQFDISGVTSAISSVVLSLNVTSAGTEYDPALGTGRLYHASDSSGATGNGAQRIIGDQLVRTMGATTGWVNIDVTDYIKADKLAGYAWACFGMGYVANGYGSSGISFSSGEDAANAPRLTITPVPEPSSLMALGGGLTGLLGLRRRRR